MDSIAHADIFFFVTTVAVVLVSVGFIIALVYIIKILNDFKNISAKVRGEGEELVKDIGILRQNFKEKGLRFIDLLAVIGRFVGVKKRSKKFTKDNSENK